MRFDSSFVAVATLVTTGVTIAADLIAYDSIGNSTFTIPGSSWVVGGGLYLPEVYNNLPAARFTSLTSGTINFISAAVEVSVLPLAPIWYQIRADDAGIPGAVLGQSAVLPTATSGIESTQIDSGPVLLAAGSNYWFSLEASNWLTGASWQFNRLLLNGSVAVLHGPLTGTESNAW